MVKLDNNVGELLFQYQYGSYNTQSERLLSEKLFFLFLILTFHNKESTAVTNKRMHMRQHAEHLGPSN